MTDQMLNRAVLAGGRSFPAGTARDAAGADAIPDGPWWSGEPPPPEARKPASGAKPRARAKTSDSSDD